MLHRIAVLTFAFFSFVAVFLSSNLITVIESATLPPNFEDVLVANVGAPTALAFTPDGRLLITTQSGQVRVYENGTLLGTPAINLNSKLCTNSERGLLGIAVDPNFAANSYVYFYYTFNKTGTCNNTAVNRVSRFVLGGNTIDAGSETVLIDNIHSPAGNHNGGDLHFGKDNLLYISVGDGGCDYAGNSGCAGANDAARDRHVMLGKILRITRDGAIPAGNPFQGAGSGRCNTSGSTTSGNWCQEIYATGLRNPFRIAFDSNAADTRFFINDVGQNLWEEIDEGFAGADYGWNAREGHCANNSSTNCGTPPAGLTNPIFDYQHTGDCSLAGVMGNSITGGAFVPNGVWTAEYDNSYLFGEYVCGKIFKITPNGNGGYNASEFVTGLGGGSAVAMIFGPYQNTQAFYYTSYAGGGQVRRIRYTGTTNRNPVAIATANPTSGPAPLDVSFNASTSSDPDNDPLTFMWDFGDGSIGSGATPVHRYTTIGTFNAVVTVSDGRGGSSTASVRIDVGNSPPQPTITSPTASQLFRVGETITLQGSATDAQDGNLPNNRLTWEVLLHHNNDHTHPFLPPTVGNNITFTAPAPEDLQAATGSFLEIRLTAADFNNLSQTIVRNFQPRKVNITFATNPVGLNLTVNNSTISGPTTVVSWDGYALNVNAPNQTATGGQQYTFVSWSDGGAAAHTITTPATAATYTATFQTMPVTPTPTPTPTATPTPTITPTPTPGVRTNVALTSNGGFASASSQSSSLYAPNLAINGSRSWGNGGGWRDGTPDSFPDWLQVDFNGSKTINEIDVFAVRDDYTNPTDPTEDTTFSIYGITNFDVQYWNGTAWATVPNGSITNNNKVWTKIQFSSITTTKLRVVVNAAQAGYSRIVELEAWSGDSATPTPTPTATPTPTPTPTITPTPTPSVRTNVALASNGGVASASSEFSGLYSPSLTINGGRAWGSGGGWKDATADIYPDWLQVDFNSSKTINEIDIYAVRDDYTSSAEPSNNETFSLYGITNFDVQYWNGTNWVTVLNGSITNNNKVVTKIVFSSVTTNKIRVVVNKAQAGYSRIVEVEAWSGGSATPTPTPTPTVTPTVTPTPTPTATPTPTPTPGVRTNVALATNGGFASASSQSSSLYAPSLAINGSRSWGNGGGWRDGTPDSFPDWLQVDFNGSKTINEIDVFAVRDDYLNTNEPTNAETFSVYGITSFDVQYWNGSAWATVPGGSVTNNNKVITKLTFAPVTTTKIRVVVNAAQASYSRIVELEAWSGG